MKRPLHVGRPLVISAVIVSALACCGLVMRRPIVNSMADPKVVIPPDVEMVFWEDQSWSMRADFRRLTLWADGRSEIYLCGSYSRRLKARWEDQGGDPLMPSVKAVRWPNPLPVDEAKRRFNAALEAGICDLKTFQPCYCDGGGTLIGVQINGKLKAATIPMFVQAGSNEKGSLNERRFLAVKQVMAKFEREPEVEE